jgi:lysophospholipase L1-like esterase
VIQRKIALSAVGVGLVAGLLAACGSPAPAPSKPARPTSVVVMGDSVASGEGTLYGYQYDPATRTWNGGNLDVTWPGPYPLCHNSPVAYGHVVATHFGAHLAQFACTGSTFPGGIEGPKLDGSVEARPAQFGNWVTRSGLNAAYDRARPDLVLVTLGADDVQFTKIVEACVENRLEDEVALAPLQCTAGDPGSTFERDYTAVVPSVVADYKTLVRWIDQRGQADHRVPKVVFTTYYDPFPTDGTSCPDTELLAAPQISFLADSLRSFNRTILRTIGGLHLPNVTAVDISPAFDGHRWCSAQPWIYGLSIFKITDPLSLLSQAPFHPTPAGQRAIASLIEPVVDRLFSAKAG